MKRSMSARELHRQGSTQHGWAIGEADADKGSNRMVSLFGITYLSINGS
jgi:hypothetical protein